MNKSLFKTKLGDDNFPKENTRYIRAVTMF